MKSLKRMFILAMAVCTLCSMLTACGGKGKGAVKSKKDKKEEIKLDEAAVEKSKQLGVKFSTDNRTITSAGKIDVSEYAIPYGVTKIDKHAFAYNTKLTQVNIPDSVKTIEPHAFAHCANLKAVVIPEKVTNISGCAFMLSGVTDVKMSKVTKIEFNAFYGCDKLENVVIPEGVIAIGSQAFCDCKSLKNVVIPKSVVTVAKDAFKGAACEAQVKKDYPHLFK